MRVASFSDDTAMVQFEYGVMVVAVALVALALYQLRKMNRGAGNKVRLSDPILVTDIQILVKSNSQLLGTKPLPCIAPRWNRGAFPTADTE